MLILFSDYLQDNGRGGDREWELTTDIHKSFCGISLYICLFLDFDIIIV